MKRLIVLLLLCATPAWADGTINTLSPGGALTGTELIPMYQSTNPAVTTTPNALSTFLARVTSIATTAPITGGTITSTGTIACPTCAITVASGTAALGTGAIASAACATVVSATATGTATTDVLMASFNGDPTAVAGYVPATAGMLTIISYPTVNTANFKVCNNTAASVTPGAITLNWRVVR